METDNIYLARNIDIINKYLIEQSEEWKLEDHNIIRTLSPRMYALGNTWEVEAIGFLMEGNGLLKKVHSERINQPPTDMWYFTDKGLLLYLNGGLEKQVKDKQAENQALETLNQSTLSINKTQKIILWVTVLASVASTIFSGMTYFKKEDDPKIYIVTPHTQKLFQPMKKFELLEEPNLAPCSCP